MKFGMLILLLAAIASVLGAGLTSIKVAQDTKLNQTKCLYSKYQTSQYTVVNNILYCKTSTSSYEKLQVPKEKKFDGPRILRNPLKMQG